MTTIRLSESNITSIGPLTISGNLNVDSNTLFVDSTNNCVGIGITNPSLPLEVNGAVKSLTNAKAWINFEPAVSPNIRSSFGISSIVRISDGRYTLNFNPRFDDSNYVVTGCSQRNGINGDSRISVVGYDPSFTTPEDNMTNIYVNIETGFSTVSAATDIFMASIAIFGN